MTKTALEYRHNDKLQIQVVQIASLNTDGKDAPSSISAVHLGIPGVARS